MLYSKILFASLPMVISSFEARAGSPLTAFNLENNLLNRIIKIQEFLSTGDGILLIGFLLWLAYIVLFFPNDTTKRL